RSVELELDRLWIQNITISMGLVNTTSLGMLLKLVAQGKLPVDTFVTHRFGLDDVMSAYETFGNAAQTKALKVLLSR
ncbi:MAG TPA: alcohol dehydrogenase, partial [Cellulomonadaceae bacterium]|nr:alcohol dehydrogenase [Cellulomonadaceae bacterium]